MNHFKIITISLLTLLTVSSCLKTVIPIPVKVDSLVSTIAGNGIPGYLDGIDTAAEFYSEDGLTIDNQGNIFIACLLYTSDAADE